MLRSKKSSISPALILGGAGLVGLSISRKFLHEGCDRLIVACLGTEDEQYEVKLLKKAFPKAHITFEPINIFSLVIRGQESDLRHFQGKLSEPVVRSSTLYRLLMSYQPTVVVDAVNTSSILAYQSDEYSGDRISQLVRFFQLLYLALGLIKAEDRPGWYIKMGTTGTGGMGLNIPYTHGEDQPSHDLLAKSALAGAYTQLLFLLSRTPEMPAVREIKPACAIAWKNIGYGPIKRAGSAITLDHDYEICQISGENSMAPLPYLCSETKLEAPFIDTGENGYFSLEEFRAITSLEQMEFVTPEELANLVWHEIQGVTTGRDVISGLDSTVVPPSYAAGVRRQYAINKIELLRDMHMHPSVAFELLGPPRLSKLLWEAFLLLTLLPAESRDRSAATITQQLEHSLIAERDLCLQITSIGLPILLKDGKRYMRGSRIKVTFTSIHERESAIELGWIDLRAENIQRWQKRIKRYSNAGTPLTPGDLASAIFRDEQQGFRHKV